MPTWNFHYIMNQFSSSHLFPTLRNLKDTECQTSLSITNSQGLLKRMYIESVMPLNHLILCHPLFLLSQYFPVLGSFLMSQLLASGDLSIRASASVLLIQGWFPLEWIDLISLQAKRPSRSPLLSNTTDQKHQFFGVQPSLSSNSHLHTWLVEKP